MVTSLKMKTPSPDESLRSLRELRDVVDTRQVLTKNVDKGATTIRASPETLTGLQSPFLMQELPHISRLNVKVSKPLIKTENSGLLDFRQLHSREIKIDQDHETNRTGFNSNRPLRQPRKEENNRFKTLDAAKDKPEKWRRKQPPKEQSPS